MSLSHVHHVKLWVGNAKQTAYYYCISFGFRPLAYRGLETGSRKSVCHVVKQGNIILTFESPLLPNDYEIGNFLKRHGDGVRDIAFEVNDLESLAKRAKEYGAQIVKDLWTESDACGSVRCITLQTYGEVTHTLIENNGYKGIFLPGYHSATNTLASMDFLPQPNLTVIDHVVGNQPEMQMVTIVKWYEHMLGLHRFWSIDDEICHSDFSAMRATVVTNEKQSFLISLCEPAPSKRKGKSQIQEFVDFNDGPGVQHIALATNDIVNTVEALKTRGVEFLTIPDSYYCQLKEKLRNAQITVKEDIEKLKKLAILVDFDSNGYLLQIFTKPLQDRPTLFLEIIQRHNFNGFGFGNFKSLFESIEIEQRKRGTLFDE